MSSEVSYIFLILSAKTNILSDGLLKCLENGFLSRNLMFSNHFITCSSKGFNSKTVVCGRCFVRRKNEILRVFLTFFLLL